MRSRHNGNLWSTSIFMMAAGRTAHAQLRQKAPIHLAHFPKKREVNGVFFEIVLPLALHSQVLFHWRLLSSHLLPFSRAR